MSHGFVFGPQTCCDLDAGTQREWVVTDGLGGYAMGTACGLRTRRYHGLLMASGTQPAQRHLALAALDPVITLPSGMSVRLGAHEWASGVIAPTGHLMLSRFDLTDGLPRWRWRVGEVVVERELAMVRGRPAVAVVHRVIAAPWPVELAVEALGTWRDCHGERHASSGPLSMRTVADGAVVTDTWRIAGPGWHSVGEWWFDAATREEAARGLPAAEDLWLAGRFCARLDRGEAMEVVAWADDLEHRPPPATEVVAEARRRSQNVVSTAKPSDDVEATLALAADAFVLAERPTPDVVAGYPWFGVWSRDTMTAYEGLFLATNRVDEGRELLLSYARTLSEGMLANTADTGRTEYNTVDAALWYLHALDRHVTMTGDTDLALAVVDRVDEIIEAYQRGTRYGIRVDPRDGLVTQGADGMALTWMDARVDGIGVTPRRGKPVEVNALWINGLASAEALRNRVGLQSESIRAARRLATEGFHARFRAPMGWLYDVVDGPTGDDGTLRPNQVLAYSLPHAPLRDERLPLAVGARLLTPLGLRSRAPGDSGYRGEHRGNPQERDFAYHEGTVWPWLLGPYTDALATDPTTDHSDIWADVTAHLGEWGIGSVSETTDGEPPHRATGCPFQAWSVAEVLRGYRGRR